MKKLFLLFVLSAAATLAAEQEVAVGQEVEILIDENYLHYSYKNDKGDAEGAYIEILRTAFSRMSGFKVHLTPVPWERGKRLMSRGEAFALAPAFFHGHDWPYLYPYSLPFSSETIVVVCDEKKLKPPRPNWPQDYVGLKIGNIAGFTGWGGSEFYRLVAAEKIVYEETGSSAQNVLMLLKGRVDCILMEEAAFNFLINYLAQTKWYDPKADVQYEIAAVVGVDSVYVGYSKPAITANKYPFHLEFRQALDIAIYRMTKSGEIDRIIQRHLSRPGSASDFYRLDPQR